MINRILIRIKVVQSLYAFYASAGGMSVAEAKKGLDESLAKGYELYNRLLLLMVELTELHERRLDDAKHKYLPTEEDLNPNMKLVDNLFVKALRENSVFTGYLKATPVSWSEDDSFLRLELDRILKSDNYAQYIATEARSYSEDCRFWLGVMKDIVLPDDNLADILETHSVYWNDDICTVGSFVVKTIKLFEQHNQSPVLPMFKDEEDRRFGPELLSYTIAEKDRCDAIIDSHVKTQRWDTERIALMDRLIMCVALAETLHYPSIPASVTLNEYIEIAKFYSTPKSGLYVNGILNSAISGLRGAGTIKK